VTIGPSYFGTLGTALLSGREPDDFDTGSGVPVVIVNERFAADLWPGEEPLGKRLRLLDGTTAGDWRTVIGVAPNIAQNDFTRQRTDPLVYIPYRQDPDATTWVLARARVSPLGLASALQRSVQAIDADLPISLGPFPLEEHLAWNYQYRGTSGALFLLCAAMALLLAAIGLYAVIAHSVGQRTREIGVRMAVGATAGQIAKLVLRQGLRPLGLGLILGLLGSLAVNRLLEASLVQVSPADPGTLLVTCAVLMLAAALGCLIPARRATRVDPVVALRHD
jgi:hypothetical protein